MLTIITRQILTWAPISSKTEIKITKPKLASSSLVNLVVCVKKPGPIADVAIKNAAPRIAPLSLKGDVLPPSPEGGFGDSFILCKFFIVIV